MGHNLSEREWCTHRLLLFLVVFSLILRTISPSGNSEVVVRRESLDTDLSEKSGTVASLGHSRLSQSPPHPKQLVACVARLLDPHS